jgi:HEAT repeat protein
MGQLSPGFARTMRFFKSRKPNVKSLARAGGVEGLVEASRYSDTFLSGDGTQVDTGAAIREEAVLALGDVGDQDDREAVVNRLAEALADPVDRVRCAAALTLYRLEEHKPLGNAVAQMPTGGGKARETAMRALLALRAPGSSATLAAALVHRPGELALGDTDASLVVRLIEEEGTPDALQAVIDVSMAALPSELRAVAYRAEELLEHLAPDSFDALVEELRDGSAPDRAAAVLGRMKDSRALKPLVDALTHPDARVRRESCAALGELRDPAAAEALLLATRDSEYEVRAGAGAALDQLGTAAIAVSVATLLGPLITSGPSEAWPLPAATNGHKPSDDDMPDWGLLLDEGPSDEGSPKDTPQRGS